MRGFVFLSKTIVIMIVLTFSVCLAQGWSGTDQKPIGSNDLEKRGAFPKIQFDETSFDFGTVYQDKSLKHTFNFKNIGTGVLRIDKVKGG